MRPLSGAGSVGRAIIRRSWLVPVLTLSACVGSVPPATHDTTAPSFAPIEFFAGRTEGTGHLKVILSRARAVHVHGEGTIESDGALTLVQHIDEEGRPARTRRWSLRPTGGGRYASALSDADGPASVMVVGNVLHIRYKTRARLAIEQWLVLQPGGRTARNHLVARKFGIRVAVLDETISRVE